MFGWFVNMKVAHKLTLGFGLIILLLIGTLGVDAYVSAQQSAIADHIVHHLNPAFDTAHEIVNLTRAADDDGAWYLLARDKKVAAAALHRYEQDVQQLRAVVTEARTLADTEVQRKEIQEFSTFYFRTGGFYEDTLGAFKQKQEGQLQAAYDNYTDSLLGPSLDVANRYADSVEGEIAQQTALESAAANLVQVLNLSLAGLALCLGAGIAIFIARSITRPLAEVQRAARAVSTLDIANLANGLTALAQGNLTVTAQAGSTPPLYESRDEIGQTAQAIRSIIEDVHRTVDGYEIARLELQRLYGQLAEQNRTLERLSTTDPLTGLPNHRTVMNRIEEELSRCQRTQASCAILFVDLDHFKRVNDTWGHQAGDALLREVGRRLKGAVRLEDFVGRYGGEEFALVLVHTDVRQAKEAAERLRIALAEKPYTWEGEDSSSVVSLPLTGSIGVAVYQEHGSTREALIEAADSAMYFAKHTGRNRVCLAGEKMAVVQEVLAKASEGQMSEGVVLQELTAIASVHDRETSAHGQRMVHLAEATARMLGRPDEELHLIRLAALLHDIGKLGIPDAILNKPGPLTEQEWAVMSRYPEIGRQVLVQAGGIFVLLSRIVVAHHERWDGSGYPYSLTQEEIPLGARILAVVDAYDAMTRERPYRKALSDADARAELERCAGSQFDPQVVEAFLHVLNTPERQAEPLRVEEAQQQASGSQEGMVPLT